MTSVRERRGSSVAPAAPLMSSTRLSLGWPDGGELRDDDAAFDHDRSERFRSLNLKT